jgi:hypothetical protein
MPFPPADPYDSFGPETLRILAAAYESASRDLPEVEGQEEVRAELARAIIRLASLGERNADRLRDGALAKLERRRSGKAGQAP